MPSDGDRPSPHARPSKLMRNKSRREQLKELSLAHVRTEQDVAGMLAVVQPYKAARPRPGARDFQPVRQSLPGL